jgi:hypothetical protein
MKITQKELNDIITEETGAALSEVGMADLRKLGRRGMDVAQDVTGLGMGWLAIPLRKLADAIERAKLGQQKASVARGTTKLKRSAVGEMLENQKALLDEVAEKGMDEVSDDTFERVTNLLRASTKVATDSVEQLPTFLEELNSLRQTLSNPALKHIKGLGDEAANALTELNKMANYFISTLTRKSIRIDGTSFEALAKKAMASGNAEFVAFISNMDKAMKKAKRVAEDPRAAGAAEAVAVQVPRMSQQSIGMIQRAFRFTGGWVSWLFTGWRLKGQGVITIAGVAFVAGQYKILFGPVPGAPASPTTPGEIPAAEETPAHFVATFAPHTIESGDTYEGIANDYKVDVQAIKDYVKQMKYAGGSVPKNISSLAGKKLDIKDIKAIEAAQGGE